MHHLDRIRTTADRPVAVGCGFEVRLEDRFQHQLRRGLRHPAPYRGNPKWALTIAPGLRDHHPAHGLRLVGLGPEILCKAVQPVLQPCRLDLLAGDAIHARCAPIGAHQLISMTQHICPVELVVEQVEPVGRLRLRLEIQLSLKRPDAVRCCQAHRQSPILRLVESTPEVRVLPSAGITRPQRYRDPVRHPPGPPPDSSVEATTLAHDGPPPITRFTLPTCRAHYPDGPERVHLSVASPSHAGLPRYSGGSASITSLSRPARASLALRPARLLNRPTAAFVTRLRPSRLPGRAARQLPEPTDNSLGGSFLHW